MIFPFPGGENVVFPDADVPQFPGSSTSEDDREYDRVPEENVIRIGKGIPGSYCVNSHSKLQCIEKDETWNPRPDEGILVNKGK